MLELEDLERVSWDLNFVVLSKGKLGSLSMTMTDTEVKKKGW